MKLGKAFLSAALLLAPLPACQILYLPFQILNTALKGVKWGFQNAGGLIPLAGYLVLEDGPGQGPPSPAPSPARLLESPPRGALALVVVPPEALGDRGLEGAIRERFPLARRIVPLRFPPEGGALPPPGARRIPLLSARPPSREET